MSTDPLAELERALEALHEATKAVLALAKTQAAESDRKATDDDEWTRLPRTGHRCHISEWSSRTICRRDDIRKKHVGGCRYYSLADVRRMIAKE